MAFWTWRWNDMRTMLHSTNLSTSAVTRYNDSIESALLASVVFILGVACIAAVVRPKSTIGKIPIAGQRSIFEPDWFARLRFIRSSRDIIHDGYSKYRDIFIVRKSGTDIVVLCDPKLVDEVRAQTKEKARSVEPFLHDFVGAYTGGKVFAESDLQNRILMQKVTPNLGAFIPIIEDELQYALDMELPKTDNTGWLEVDMVSAFPRIVARIIARVLLGPKGCRNEAWLQTTARYTRNVFVTGFVLRFVPRFFRPLIAALLPTYWELLRDLAKARSIIGGLASDRSSNPQEDVLQWIMDAANVDERKLDDLSQRMLVLSLSGIHTTAMTMVHAIYDLCARADDCSIIRDELSNVLNSGNGINKGTLLEMHKLDSLIKESQRLNPVFLLTFNRILPCAVFLSNGITLPAGTRVAVPQHAILNDPAKVPGENPHCYDPWRYAKLREDPDKAHQYQFAMVDSKNMAFGYGKYSCPGRFFVATEIKIILAHLLLKYDWKLPDGRRRPQNFTIDSDMYPDLSARVLIRRRTDEGPLS
ncbi:unnamed protein product [Zymoseptoria tritici ST99CH_1A5]|uniref:Cytochrome P450 monooxygenase n=2 Tax=Zymoseptoria tritici TaxID=1047171 RepID=A0A1X7RFE7_ZYMT9|nr:unnamed protein product [Zymoseptoria tritici ST99CH_3D7]SMY19418.1 unnamed protein product [Zymoseptoria tritici ST99CH_1A5]